jgi:two-component system response regulator
MTISNKFILLVEDSEDDYEAIVRAFKRVDMHNPVFWCQTGRDAMDYLTGKGAYAETPAENPGLILLDLNLPGLDGRKTLQMIKANDNLKHIPVAILTTSMDERDIASCYEMGANSYVQKPVSFDDLTAAIRHLKNFWVEASDTQYPA